MLTAAQRSILRTELLTDPLAIGYAGMSHDEAVESLNTKNRTVVRSINKAGLLRWNAMTGAVAKLQTASQTAENVQVRAIASSALLLVGSNVDTLVLDSELMTLVSALVTAGVFTQNDINSLTLRASELVSRCDELCGPGALADNQDVYICRVEMS